jgi:hypothetical protein
MADIQRQWPFEQIRPTDNEAITDIIGAVEAELDAFDVDIQQLLDERSLDTASGPQLELLAAEVGVARETNETDERLRLRAKLRKAQSNSRSTVGDLAQILAIVFDTTEDITVSVVNDAPVITLTVPSALLDDVPIDRVRLESILADGIPTSDGLQIITDDVFRFGESGQQGIGEGELI